MAKAIRDDVRSRKMPPWLADPRYGHFSNDPSLTEQQVETIWAWVHGDAPAGDARNAPAPVHWTNGWNIREPDLVLRMAKPVAIPVPGRCRIHVRNRA